MGDSYLAILEVLPPPTEFYHWLLECDVTIDWLLFFPLSFFQDFEAWFFLIYLIYFYFLALLIFERERERERERQSMSRG